LKHAQTCLYYNEVMWLAVSCALKSFRELHSHTLYVCWLHGWLLVILASYTQWFGPKHPVYTQCC